MDEPKTIKELPLSLQVVALMYRMGAGGEEAAERSKLGLPVGGMTEREAIHYALTGEYQSSQR